MTATLLVALNLLNTALLLRATDVAAMHRLTLPAGARGAEWAARARLVRHFCAPAEPAYLGARSGCNAAHAHGQAAGGGEECLGAEPAAPLHALLDAARGGAARGAGGAAARGDARAPAARSFSIALFLRCRRARRRRRRRRRRDLPLNRTCKCARRRRRLLSATRARRRAWTCCWRACWSGRAAPAAHDAPALQPAARLGGVRSGDIGLLGVLLQDVA